MHLLRDQGIRLLYVPCEEPGVTVMMFSSEKNIAITEVFPFLTTLST